MRVKKEITKKAAAEKPSSKGGMPEPKEGKPSRASFHHGSTTQGGSDFGQGSMQMGRYGNAQGSESNEGANYDGEQGWNNEALRREDISKAKARGKGKKK